MWLSEVTQKKIAEKMNAELITEGRWGNDARELYFWYFQLSVFFKFSDWLDVGPGYRHIRHAVPQNRGPFATIYEPILAITAHTKINKWKFLDRSRFEIRVFQNSKPLHIYRNRFSIVSPWKLTQARIKPYFDEEFFWREERGVNQVRLTFGGKIGFSKKYKGMIYYLLRYQKPLDGPWRKHNILGLRFVGKF